jgi:hypothetical protein
MSATISYEFTAGDGEEAKGWELSSDFDIYLHDLLVSFGPSSMTVAQVIQLATKIEGLIEDYCADFAKEGE